MIYQSVPRTGLAIVVAIGLAACDEAPTGNPDSEPPTVTIEAPADGSVFAEGEEVTFEGSAEDPEDGTLTGNALLWVSEPDGPLGRGEVLTTSTLSANAHVITLIAADPDGVVASTSINVLVRAPQEKVVDR